jgi:hypothetical protein
MKSSQNQILTSQTHLRRPSNSQNIKQHHRNKTTKIKQNKVKSKQDFNLSPKTTAAKNQATRTPTGQFNTRLCPRPKYRPRQRHRPRHKYNSAKIKQKSILPDQRNQTSKYTRHHSNKIAKIKQNKDKSIRDPDLGLRDRNQATTQQLNRKNDTIAKIKQNEVKYKQHSDLHQRIDQDKRHPSND